MVTKTRSREYVDLPVPQPDNRKHIFKIVTASVCGVMFGFSVEKGRVFEPLVVRNQMMMKTFVMLKMFLSAVIAGMFCMSILSMIPATRKQFLNARLSLVNRVKDRGYMAVIIGGAVLGSGMALAGTCPGVVFAQLGSGTQNVGYTLLGTLTGAFIYGYLEPVLMSIVKPKQQPKNQFLFQILGSPYFVTALPTAAMLSVVVFTLELIFPWDTEVVVSGTTENILTVSSWPPFVTGSIVGALQIPLILFIEGLLGASSSYCTVAAQFLITTKLQQSLPYLIKYKSGPNNWWKVTFVMFAVVGAFLSSNLSGTYGSVQGMSMHLSFIGGALMIMGSRLAEGCTSGHGISGVGLLNLLSITTVISMFAGGVTTALIIQMMS